MTGNILNFIRRDCAQLICVWTATGNSAQPLFCNWVERDSLQPSAGGEKCGQRYRDRDLREKSYCLGPMQIKLPVSMLLDDVAALCG